MCGGEIPVSLEKEKNPPTQSEREIKDMGNKYLSEVIDYEKDIGPYQIIQIYSGVGSGKNHWVETLAEAGYSILLITSRKATADAQARKLKGDRWIDLNTLCQEGFGTRKQKKVVVTNAGIEQFLKNKYTPDDEATHIWKYFDIIVLDEAHSLVSDATFSDSPFHVKAFLKWVQLHEKKCKLIFMTGTPDSIAGLFSEKLQNSNQYKFINAYDKCKHVDPKEVYIYPKANIEYDIIDSVKKGNRIIYFANSITRMEQLAKNLIDIGMNETDIGIAYSGDERRNFPKSLLDGKKLIRDSLVEQEKLPPEIKVLLTTSQNKEGININNDDIKIMISESCEKSSLIQMAGRVRKGLDVLVVLFDAKQHEPRTTLEEIELDNYCVKSINEYWDYYNGAFPDQAQIINLIENKFPSVRYNYLNKKFKFYKERERGFETIGKDRESIQYWVSICRKSNEEEYYIQDEHGDYMLLSNYEMKKWFPHSTISFYLEETLENQRASLKADISKLIEKNYLNHELTKARKKTLLDEVNQLLKDSSYNLEKLKINLPIKQLNTFFKKIELNYTVEEVMGKRKGEYFQLVKNS